MASRIPSLASLLFAVCASFGGLLPCRGDALGVTYDAVETWSVTLNYRDWGNGFTGTRSFNGREVGRVTVRDGTYTLANKVGHHLTGLDSALTRRNVIQSDGVFSISGGDVFAPAFGVTTHAIVLLGAFIVSVPLIDGDVPTFDDFEAYAGSGAPAAIIGGGSMTGPLLTVSVQSTLSLTPVTLPTPTTDGPFGLAAGNYSGVFLEPSGVAAESSGFLSAKVNASGSFSARLITFSGSAGLSGRFDESGRFTNSVRLGTNTLGVEFRLDPLSTGPLSAVILGASWTSVVDAQRAAFDTKIRPANDLANRYTLRIRGSAASDQPQGDGVAAAQISIGGQVSVKGTLADGTPLVQNSALSENGRWPVYQKLPGRRGFILGWLEAGGQNASAIQGVMHWSTLPGTTTAYPGGIDFTTTAEGSVWHPFDGGFLFENSPVEFSFSDGNLSSPVYREVSFTEQGKVVTGSEKLQLKLSLYTGLFSGTFEPVDLGTKLRFKGAILPQQGYGAGYFLGANAWGHLDLH
jgi:hypothetical protein